MQLKLSFEMKKKKIELLDLWTKNIELQLDWHACNQIFYGDSPLKILWVISSDLIVQQ